MARYLLLAAITLWAAALQLRLSIETIQHQRQLDFYVPFMMEPFTAEIYDARGLNWEKGQASVTTPALHRGDKLIAINGRPYQGYAMYLHELWKQQDPDAPPPLTFFTITVQRKDQSTHEIEFSFPHCTCGIPTLFEAIYFWALPQFFCITIGALAVALRPKSPLAWTWFAAMLSLTQLHFWPEPYLDFLQTSDTMAFRDAMRMPAVGYRAFVQYAWPALLVPRGRAAITAFLGFAAIQSTLAVAHSEGWNQLAPLHQFLRHHTTETTIAALLLFTLSAWTFHLKLGALATALTLAAATAFYLPAQPVTEVTRHYYSDNTTRFEPVVPAFHQSPGAIIAIATTLYLLAALLLFRSQLKWRPLVAAALCLPLAIHVSGALGAWWHPFAGPNIERWPWLVTITAAAGLALATHWITQIAPLSSFHFRELGVPKSEAPNGH